MDIALFVGVWLLAVALAVGIMVVVLRVMGRFGIHLTRGRRRAVIAALPAGTQTPSRFAVGVTPPPSAPAMIGYVALGCTPLTPIAGLALFAVRHQQRLVAETPAQLWVLRPKSRLGGRQLVVVGSEPKAEWTPERRHGMNGLLGTLAGERIAFLPGYAPDPTGRSGSV